MGLDVVLVKGAKLVASREAVRTMPDKDRDALLDDAVNAYNIDLFRPRADGLEEGYYTGDVTRVCGWSYGGYNRFREKLCEVALGCEPEEIWGRCKAEEPGIMDRPLVPLIHFADNEGFFGPTTSARLAAEMAEIEKAFAAVADDYDRQRFARLRQAFQDAADTKGIVAWR